MLQNDYVELGKTGIKISAIGLGIMQWGNVHDTATNSVKQEIFQIYHTTLSAGVNFFDSAEMYGNGRSEKYLGECIKTAPPENIIIATKFMPFPWRLAKGELRNALLRSLKRLGLAKVDLYQMHWPFPPISIRSWMEAMADAVAEGLIRSVGVSNYSPNQMTLAYETLAKYHIPLASNQVKYSLLHRNPEKIGLIDLCRKIGVSVIAYSPLEKGVLTGKYSPERLPSGYRAWRYNSNYLKKISPLIEELRQVGAKHQGKEPGQVALNWLTCKGAIPIPGARTNSQAKENLGGLGWKLSDEELAKLDNISEAVTR
jgi:aryl-alcohol dehydrogenase-like predicted oxidoreductase